MRRLFFMGLLLAALVADGSLSFAPAGAATAPPPATGADPPPPDRTRGLVYDGLRRTSRDSHCRGAFQLDGLSDRAGRPLCTHGPDPAPPGVDVRAHRPPPPTAGATGSPSAAAAASGSVRCDGDGSSGYRVQLVYARPENHTDRYDQFAESFQQWAGAMDAVYDNSAAQTSGSRHVRFVTDPSCRAVVARVVLSSSGDDSLTNTVSELSSQGYTRSDRKFLVFMDASVYCGIGQIYPDDRPGQENRNNGVTSSPGMVARVDSGCWGQSNSTEAHELMHTLGGVQPGAPHGTPGFHCTEEYDRMCYQDGSGGGGVQYRCNDSSRENVFDCNNDDYFSTASVVTGWLGVHWNTASSRFLIKGRVSSPTTTSTTVPTTTTTTVTTAPSSTTTTTTLPSTGGVPSAPRYLRAGAPAGGVGVGLSWSPPLSPGGSAVSGYRVYRGTSPWALAFLAASPSTSYTDSATVSGTSYYYQVTAVNNTGEGPRSNFTFRMAV